MTEIWKYLDLPRLSQTAIDESSLQLLLTAYALHNNKIVYTDQVDGDLENENDFIAELIKVGGRVIQKGNGGAWNSVILVWDNAPAYLVINTETRNKATMSYLYVGSLDKTVIEDTIQIAKKYITTIRSSGRVFALLKSEEGYRASPIGSASHDLEILNYTKKVSNAIEHVASDLLKESPCGRLTILNGDPGTGKTYLVRALLKQVPAAVFLVIHPSMVQDCTSPAMISTFLDLKSKAAGPIVLVLEDADDILVPRGTDNMPSISSLLNLSDGIMGKLLDIRAVATTNATKLDLDPALLRPGRICRHIQVDRLTPFEAAKVYEKLTGKLEIPVNQATYSLAEIYKFASDAGWESAALNLKIGSVGFKSSQTARLAEELGLLD